LLLEVSNLTVCFDKAMIINDLSMHINDGELVSLVGPNGAGKSTLLKRASTGVPLKVILHWTARSFSKARKSKRYQLMKLPRKG